MDVVPRAEDVDGKWSEVLSLRKYMQHTNSPGETTPPPAIHPGRTVDGPTLVLLKSSNYPFTLCEEAPVSYVPPPVPFDVDGEVSRLRGLILEVQDELEAYQATLREASGSQGSAPSLSPNQILAFLNDSIPYMELAWGVSSLQWFHRWVLTHSISALWTAREQLEYVLTDNGLSLPKSVEEIEFHTKKSPFPMAVDRLEKDRKVVIQLERSRLHSSSRTYRDRVPASVVTAATTPYMTVEEKYMYQELFNETEHRMQTLHFSRMKERASRGNSAMNSSHVSGRINSSVIRRSSISFLEPDAFQTTADALHALCEEETMIRGLIEMVKDRKSKNIRFDKSEIEREASRSAQITVYGCLISDENLMSTQAGACQDFCSEYEEWLGCYGFQSHEDLMENLSNLSDEMGKWPAAQPGGYHHQGHHHHMPLHSEDKKHFDGSVAQGRPILSEAEKKPAASSVTVAARQREDGLVDDRSARGAQPRSPTVGKLKESFSMSQVLFELLQQIVSAKNEDGESLAKSNAIDRMWLIQALRLVTINFARAMWNPKDFLTGSVQIDQELSAMLLSSPTLQSRKPSGAVLVQIIRCLCQALAIQPSPAATYDVVQLTIPASSFENSNALSGIEITRWGALLDALWFQVDPTGESNGALLQSDEVRVHSNVRFFNLSAANISNSVLQLFYVVDEGQITIYTVREVVNKPLPFVKSERERHTFIVRVMAALAEVENVGILGFYACRVEEAGLVSLADTVFVYTRTVAGEVQLERLGLLPPPAMELRRITVGEKSSIPGKIYDETVNFSTVGLQLGDLISFLGCTPKPLLSSTYYYGETLREQAFWEIENKVTSHAFVALPSHPLNIDGLRATRPLSIQREALSAPQQKTTAPVAPRQRQITAGILRQLAHIQAEK